ncbi:hypothetical protein I4U23_029593 [Adineta vaga]|nr:hypothetical protein I4U23_029593 [Adineta vaga]
MSSECKNPLHKKFSDVSIQSQYHLHPFYKRSDSMLSIRTSNMHNNNNSNQTQHQGNFSICDSNYQQSNHFPYINDEQDLQLPVIKTNRSYKQRLLFRRKKHSLTDPTNVYHQPSQNKINKRTKKKAKSIFVYNPITSSSSTTTTSNVTRSTINTTGSESSVLVDRQNTKLTDSINNKKQKSRHFFRK